MVEVQTLGAELRTFFAVHMVRMKKVLAALALVSVLALTACSDYTGDAVVDGKEYHPGYSYTSLISVNNSLIPMTNFVPDDWTVALHGTDGKSFTIDVSKAGFDFAEQGATVHLDHGQMVR